MEIKAKFTYLLYQINRLNKEPIKKTLSHPIMLLIVGAIISSLVIPYFTRQWQDNQKQLELKTALADDINKAISDSIVSARLTTAGQIDQQDWDNSYKNWEIAREVIGSKIQAYFSNNEITLNWNNLSSAVEELSNIAIRRTNDPRDICNRLGHILKLHTSYPQNNPLNIDTHYLTTEYHCNRFYSPVFNLQNIKSLADDKKNFATTDNNSVDWNALLYYNETNGNEFRRSFSTIQNDTEDHKNELLESIFKLPINAFK